MAFCPKEVVDGWDHSMHAREVGKENSKALFIQTKGKGSWQHQTKGKFVMWACPIVVMDGQPMGWWATLKGCPQQTRNSW